MFPRSTGSARPEADGLQGQAQLGDPTGIGRSSQGFRPFAGRHLFWWATTIPSCRPPTPGSSTAFFPTLACTCTPEGMSPSSPSRTRSHRWLSPSCSTSPTRRRDRGGDKQAGQPAGRYPTPAKSTATTGSSETSRGDLRAATSRLPPALNSDQRDRADSAEPSERADPAENPDRTEPTEPTDSAEPTDPTLSTDPTDPIDRTDPRLAMERNDASDQSERSPTDAILASQGASSTPGLPG
jgi:hypothetical protein